MKKIPTLFMRDPPNRARLLPQLTPGCEWVIQGRGAATRKWDGTACLVRGGKLFKRYDAKGKRRPPSTWEPCEPQPDPLTGHWPGWVPVTMAPEDQWHRDAWYAQQPFPGAKLLDGTYELCGPKVAGNAERLERHVLIQHGTVPVRVETSGLDTEQDLYDRVREALEREAIEGIVWWSREGLMAKVKARDFGLPWPVQEPAREVDPGLLPDDPTPTAGEGIPWP